MSTRVTEADFMTGLFCALRLRGLQGFSREWGRYDSAVKAAFDRLCESDVDPRFRIRPHFIHGDSGTARRGLRCGLIAFGYPGSDCRIDLDPVEAEFLLRDLPLTRADWEAVADAFIEAHDTWVPEARRAAL